MRHSASVQTELWTFRFERECTERGRKRADNHIQSCPHVCTLLAGHAAMEWVGTGNIRDHDKKELSSELRGRGQNLARERGEEVEVEAAGVHCACVLGRTS